MENTIFVKDINGIKYFVVGDTSCYNSLRAIRKVYKNCNIVFIKGQDHGGVHAAKVSRRKHLAY